MQTEDFERLLTLRDAVRDRGAPVPVAEKYVEYWHGAAFRVLDTVCVASMREARKIVDLTPTIPVPGVQHWVRGIANIGGRVLSIADLGSFLSSGVRGSRGKQALVISGRGIQAGLVLDESLGGVRFSAEQLRTDIPVEEHLAPFADGVFRSETGDFVLFSIDKLLNDSRFSHAAVANAQ